MKLERTIEISTFVAATIISLCVPKVETLAAPRSGTSGNSRAVDHTAWKTLRNTALTIALSFPVSKAEAEIPKYHESVLNHDASDYGIPNTSQSRSRENDVDPGIRNKAIERFEDYLRKFGIKEVGEVIDVEKQNVSLRRLGITPDGLTTRLNKIAATDKMLPQITLLADLFLDLTKDKSVQYTENMFESLSRIAYVNYRLQTITRNNNYRRQHGTFETVDTPFVEVRAGENFDNSELLRTIPLVQITSSEKDGMHTISESPVPLETIILQIREIVENDWQNASFNRAEVLIIRVNGF